MAFPYNRKCHLVLLNSSIFIAYFYVRDYNYHTVINMIRRKKCMKKKLKNAVPLLTPYILLLLITMGILFSVYYVKGIFPFGDKSIAYADIGQMYVPLLYHTWDALHGLANPFLDWYAGTGINMISTDIFSPFNIFFLFIPRDSILESMSFFLAFKVLVSSITCHIFIDKVFNNINAGYKIAFSTLFAMSGYVLQYYTNIKWLEVLAVFPLLMLGFYYLMKKEKIILYTVCVTLTMVISFYLSVQVMLFLLLTAGLYIALMVEKSQRKNRSFYLALSTIIGMGMSMFKSLTVFLLIMGSSRGEGNADKGYLKIIDVTFKALEELTGNDVNKWFMFLGLELAVIICVILIARFTKHKRATLFFIGELLIVGLPVFFEGTNKLLHMGSYVGFPMRSAFTISFVLIVGACYCLSFEKSHRLNKAPTANSKNEKLAKLSQIHNSFYTSLVLGVMGITAICLSVPLMLESSKLIRRYGCFFLSTKELAIPKNYLKVVIITVIGLLFILAIKNSKIKNLFIVVAIIIPLCINTYSFIGADKYVYAEQYPDFVAETEMLNDNLPKEENPLNRIKTADNCINTNYPLILQRGSLSSWNGYATNEALKALKSMGYSSAFTRMLDTGGTLLTDAVMGIKNTLSTTTLSPEAYTCIDTINNYNYYINNFTLPTCVVADKLITEIDTNSTAISKVNNKIYHSLSDDPESIMENLSTTTKLGCSYNAYIDSDSMLNFNIKVTGEKMLYFKSFKKNLTIYVDGKELVVPSYMNLKNTKYTAQFNNSLLSLGVFNNQMVNVKIASGEAIAPSEVYLYAFDIDKLGALCDKYNSQNYTATAKKNKLNVTVATTESNKMLFVPVCYDKGWSATVNGKPVEIKPAINNGFMAIPLENGTNEVTLKFFPTLMPVGIVISIVFIAIFIAYIMLRKRSKNTEPPTFLAILAQTVLYLVWGGVIAVVYIVPMFYQIFLATPK